MNEQAPATTDAELIEQSGLFDAQWYLAEYRDVAMMKLPARKRDPKSFQTRKKAIDTSRSCKMLLRPRAVK